MIRETILTTASRYLKKGTEDAKMIFKHISRKQTSNGVAKKL